jgi:glutathione S-transferase
MKLYYQTHSPYARKVLVMAIELGLADRLEVIHHETSPTTRNETIYQVNPLGKVPVLVLENGEVLYDSIIICDYLDTMHQNQKLIPAQGPERYQAMRLHALAQGLCDVGIKLRWEVERRPVHLRYPAYGEGQKYKLEESYRYLEQQVDFIGPMNVGHVALGTALDWIVFRKLSNFSMHPRLHAWYLRFCDRASMKATEYSGKTHD